MIFIREISRGDLPLINKYRNDQETVGALVTPFRFVNIETDNDWFDSYQSKRSTNVRCAICLRKTNELIGVVYLLNIDWISRAGDFGIFIGESNNRGKGFGYDATRKMLSHGFNSMNLNRVQLTVLENNSAALKLYKKVGFREEGCLRQAIFKDNEYREVIIMALLRSEFKY